MKLISRSGRFEDADYSFLLPINSLGGVNGYWISLPYYTMLVKLDSLPFPKALDAISINTINTINTVVAINRHWKNSPEYFATKHIVELTKKAG